MSYKRTDQAIDVLNTLKQYRFDLQESQQRKPYWPLLDRLISRETELTPVWTNIARQKLSWQQCYTLIEQIFFAGAYGTKERHKKLKADYSRLVDLNINITSEAEKLADLLTEQEEILNRNAFLLERTTHIVDMIETASAMNGHYCSFLREPLGALSCRYDGKYWPSLPQILHVVAREASNVEFKYQSEQAIVDGRGGAVPDYLRELFECLEVARTSHWGLPKGFTLTDTSLALLVTVSLDVDDISSDRIKTLRHRLNKEGYPGAWATSRKSSSQC
ncbi:hypothetical protein ABEG79_22705 [Pantoea agglomerans]|uniref:hypothetical protein n=1 Tax=Enterobacter agglomerans TaxID=549 RepID=UPI0016549564|nr:hypothetical protein [Pantoea agglomerans]